MSTTTMGLGGVLTRLDREYELYRALRDLSRRQTAILAADAGVETLLDILGRKQSVLAEIGSLDGELAPFKREWRLRRGQFDPVERAAVDERLRALHALLEELIAMEEASRRRLMGPRDDDAPTPVRTREAHRTYMAARRRVG